MKKTIFLLTGILLSLNTFAQRIALNKAVGFDVPKNLNKITKEQALAHAAKKFKGDKMVLDFYTGIDDIIIEIKSFDTTFNFEPGHAADLKKGQDALGRKALNYTSNLKIINNNTVVITNSIIKGTGYCYFFCYNASNTRVVSGCLIYAEVDKDKVTVILDPILNGIKFKD